LPVGSVLLPPPTATRRPFEEEFRRHYPAIRGLLDRHREPGLGLVVASGDGLEGTAWVPAEPHGLNPVIVGRHNSAEVFLPRDPSPALRHPAVLLSADDRGRSGSGCSPCARPPRSRTSTIRGSGRSSRPGRRWFAARPPRSSCSRRPRRTSRGPLTP